MRFKAQNHQGHPVIAGQTISEHRYVDADAPKPKPTADGDGDSKLLDAVTGARGSTLDVPDFGGSCAGASLAPVMLKELIIGMDGFIGGNLCRHLPDSIRTTRRQQQMEAAHFFDLTKQGPLPDADVVYLCAGINGNLTCAQDPQRSYRANVDGTIYVAEYFRDKAHVIWVSSTTVEWLVEHYGRQKRIAECYLRALPHVGIVRAGRVLKSNVDDLCRLMVEMGRNRQRGIVLWNEDEKPYQH